MPWYAYCITEQQAFHGDTRARRPFLLEHLRGVSDAPVFGYPSGEFAVIASEWIPGTQLDQRAVLAHAKVVSDCFRNTTVLPFRFGTVFDNDDALRRAVRSNRKAFLTGVDKLRGKAEMHLKLVLRDGRLTDARGVKLPDSVGSEYLMKLREKASIDRERQTKLRSISVQVHKMFCPLDVDITCKAIDSGGMLIDFAHLIDTASIEKYQNRFQSATRQLKDWQIALSGPWPPYHFTPSKLRSGVS